MAERKRVVLIFDNSGKWPGGTYYILNLINDLDTLPDVEKPEIILYCNSEDFEFAQTKTNYPYLVHENIYTLKHFFRRLINKLSVLLTKKLRMPIYGIGSKADVVYPVQYLHDYSANKAPLLIWIPDLQQKYLPHLFPSIEKEIRENNIREIIKRRLPIVFSSRDALDSFDKFYPEGHENKKFVWHFASGIPVIDKARWNEVKKKYNVKDPYFFCGNQFWIHKNHRLLFEAVKLLKDRGVEITLYCTGQTKDSRNPDYFEELKNYIKEQNLEENIHILGLIDRDEQLNLFYNSQAIVQPSLFEGWNTSVEEAKALNKFLVLSDINVHREQVSENVIFFNPEDLNSLADALETVAKDAPLIKGHDYKENIHRAAKEFMAVVEELSV